MKTILLVPNIDDIHPVEAEQLKQADVVVVHVSDPLACKMVIEPITSSKVFAAALRALATSYDSTAREDFLKAFADIVESEA